MLLGKNPGFPKISEPLRIREADPCFHASACASLLTALVCVMGGWTLAVEGKDPVDYVDPLVDSAHSRWIFFSSASRPFAMVNLSPDTDAAGPWNSGYCYHTGSLCGFSHVHAWELGGVSVMPVAGEVDPTAGPDALRSPFRHDGEVCQAGYHAVTLDRYKIRVELTSTRRSRLPPLPVSCRGWRPGGVPLRLRARFGARYRRPRASDRRYGGRRLPGGRSDSGEPAAETLHGVLRGPLRPTDPGLQRLDRETAVGRSAARPRARTAGPSCVVRPARRAGSR